MASRRKSLIPLILLILTDVHIYDVDVKFSRLLLLFTITYCIVVVISICLSNEYILKSNVLYFVVACLLSLNSPKNLRSHRIECKQKARVVECKQKARVVPTSERLGDPNFLLSCSES